VSGTLSVLSHPAPALSFSPATVPQNTPSVLTFQLTNANTAAITGAAFTQALPAGLLAAVAAGATTTCGGIATVGGSGTSVTLSGGTIPQAGFCRVTVNVAASSTGTYTSTLAAGALTSDNAGANSAPASASLIVF
jgi:hypothetical protein